MRKIKFFFFCHLVLFQAALLHHLVPLLLEGNDDESHKDVDEEEGKDDKVDDVEDGHLHPVAVARASVLLRHVHRVLQNSRGRSSTMTGNFYWPTQALATNPLF